MSSVRSVHYRTEAADYSKEGWWTCSIASDISMSSSMRWFQYAGLLDVWILDSGFWILHVSDLA